MGQTDFNIDLNADLNVYQNIAQDCIVITKDKLELVLLKTEKSLSAKKSWITPLSLVVTCIVALASADFKNFILSSSEWKALFVFATIVFSIWLFRTLSIAWKNRNKGNIDNIINQIISESKKGKQNNEQTT